MSIGIEEKKRRSAEASKKWQKANRAKVNAYKRAYYLKNKETEKAKARAWRTNNREKYLAGRRSYEAANREKITRQHKEYVTDNKEKVYADDRDWRLRNKDKVVKMKDAYRRKITPEQKEKWKRRVWQRRGWPEPTRERPELCECCGGAPSGRGCLHLDHCHDTNAFRGWLCSDCNLAIGKLGDNETGLENALAYLRRARKLEPAA